MRRIPALRATALAPILYTRGLMRRCPVVEVEGRPRYVSQPPMLEVVEFSLDESRYAVPMARVLEAVGRVLLTPLAVPVPHVVGIFGYRGGVAVAVDARRRLGHPARRAKADDHFLVLRGGSRTPALVVDRVLGLRSIAESDVAPPPLRAAHVRGVVVMADGLLLLDDLDAVLSLEEEQAIDGAIRSLSVE